MKKLGILFIFLLFSSFVIAQPPFTPITSVNQQNGLEIFFPNFEYYQLGDPIKFHFHVINISNGLQVTPINTDCLFHLYNSTGGHIQENMTVPGDSNNIEWSIPIIEKAWGNKGVYTYYIYCNSSTYDGGAVKEGFEIADLTSLGLPRENTNLLSIIIANIFLVGVLIFLGYTGKTIPSKFIPFAIALFEVIFLIGILWVNQAEGNVISMLRINFISVILVSAFFGLWNLYRYVEEMLKLDNDEKEEEEKWGQSKMYSGKN